MAERIQRGAESPPPQARMWIRLAPLDAADLGAIEIRDALVGVGRDRGDFRQLPAARTARLSERHARLFGRDGILYVVDLGSRHGTFVNGRALTDKPVALAAGDEINFGGDLPFRIELPANTDDGAATAAADTTLRLEPVDPQGGPEPIRIESFPFSISKQAPAFAKYAECAGAELDFISRRHAQLSRQDGRVLLQDLGSTNGTFVEGRALGKEPVVLESGQRVAFGGDYFVYRVVLEGQPAARPPARAPSAKSSPGPELDKTTFIAAGTRFLDILCADDLRRASGGKADPDAGSAEAGEPAQDAASAPARRDRESRPRRSISRAAWRRLQLGALAILALFGTLGYFALRDTPTERIESLLAAGRGPEALAVARASAGSLQGDSTFERLASRALAATTLGPWLDAYDDHDFARMQDVLESGSGAAPDQPWSRDYLATLGLIGDVERAASQRGGEGRAWRVLDPDATEARQLVDAWNQPRPDKRQATQVLLAVLPASDAALAQRYRDAYQKAASEIRGLESRLAVYEPAVAQLEAMLSRDLRDGSLDRLGSELDDYAERYSELGGFDALHQDLGRYRELTAAVKGQRVLDAVRLATTQFHAPAFAEAAERLVRSKLPQQTFLDAYAAALDAWQAGQTKSALTQLEALSSGPAGEIAQREIARMRATLDEVNALQGLKPSAAYDERLLKLYRGLDPSRDRYILTLFQDKYAQSRAAVEKRALQAAQSAGSALAEYRRQGGITSTLRLRSGVSSAYKQRAAILSRAAGGARQARRLYEQAQRSVPARQESTLTEIEREVALQHQALDELAGVLASSTLQGKQALLPKRLR